jgi:hypothetical protein
MEPSQCGRSAESARGSRPAATFQKVNRCSIVQYWSTVPIRLTVPMLLEQNGQRLPPPRALGEFPAYSERFALEFPAAMTPAIFL